MPLISIRRGEGRGGGRGEGGGERWEGGEGGRRGEREVFNGKLLDHFIFSSVHNIIFLRQPNIKSFKRKKRN